MRDEMIEIEEPGVYNAFVRGLKQKLLAGELGGDRREMWDGIRKHRLGLVEKRHSESSEVGEEEANKVSFPSTSLKGVIVLPVKVQVDLLIPTDIVFIRELKNLLNISFCPPEIMAQKIVA